MEIMLTTWADGSLAPKANSLYTPINRILNEKLGSYGEGLQDWLLMFIILGEKSLGHDGPERVLFKKKDKAIDLRLHLDHKAFKIGSDDERRALMIATILRAVDLIGDKKIPDFDFPHFKSDIHSVFKEEGWIA